MRWMASSNGLGARRIRLGAEEADGRDAYWQVAPKRSQPFSCRFKNGTQRPDWSRVCGRARRLTGRARALFDRRHRLASRPCEGVDLFFQGERLGRVSAMLPSVAVPSRSGSAGAMHPATA